MIDFRDTSQLVARSLRGDEQATRTLLARDSELRDMAEKALADLFEKGGPEKADPRTYGKPTREDDEQFRRIQALIPTKTV